MKNSLFLLIIFFSQVSYSQKSLESLNIPVKVKKTMNRVYRGVDISSVWSDNQNRFYYFKFKENDIEYNVTIDSSGFWSRTYRNVKFDTISAECLSAYKKQKELYEKEYRFETFYYKTKESEEQDYKFDKVLFEYNRQNPEGYYEFIIFKTIAPTNFSGINDSILYQKKIKINCECELLNNEGKKVVKIDGEPLMGYTYLTNELKSNTTTIEYSNNKKNGLYIQYFKYPDEVASVEYYIDDKLSGPFFYYWKNGVLGTTGIYENGERKILNKWMPDGTTFIKKIIYDSLTSQFKNIDFELLNGRVIIEGKEAFFTSGNIDSLIIGKDIKQNYIDSTRTLSFFDKNGNITNIRKIKILQFDFIIDSFEGHATIIDNSKFSNEIYEIIYYKNSNVIKEKGSYKDFKKNGLWLYYNEKGILIKEENY